jgi:hypothetical protein
MPVTTELIQQAIKDEETARLAYEKFSEHE